MRALPTDCNKVYFGAQITLVYEDERAQTVCLVGPDEIDPSNGLISIDSPLARAVLGKRLDTEIILILPSDEGAPRRVQAEIIAMSYPLYLLQANDSLAQSEAL